VLDDGTNFLRVSQWSTIGGEEFIVKAFEYAHQADPNAQLVLNDYNIEKPAKREKLLRLVRLLKERKTPIHAVGLQGHFELDSIPYAELENTIDEIQKLGLKVIVSECDIDAIPRAKWWAEGGKYREELAKFNPYREGCPPEILQRQAEQYQKLFEVFLRHSNAIARVSFWDLHDGRSWLNTFPWDRTNYPLLFDRNQKPKPAFAAVLRAQ
jgi:endo-1,4-beta-xylanase